MRYIYSFILYLALPFILLRLWWKSRKLLAYKQRWAERLAYIPNFSQQRNIWIHSVSVGETIAAILLARAILRRHPDMHIVITTMTPTGSDMASRHASEHIHHVYVPYDLPDAVKRFLKRVRPKLIIVMETELWPNMLHYSAKQHIPILLANARLSPRSAKGYRYIKQLTRNMLNCIQLIAAQTQEDAKRFIALGADPQKVINAGSIKFDTEIPKDLVQQGKFLRASWDVERPVWIAASTHPGEDEIILDAFTKIREVLPTTLLILVPRHPERFKDVANLCQQRKFSVVKRSQGQPCSINTSIFLGDSLGELFLFYSASDVAFVGGSLVSVGGHNLLEPAALGLPVVTGPHLFNFAEISRLLSEAKAAQIVHDENELAISLIQLLQDSRLRKEMGEKGHHVVEQNRGALEKHLKWIDQQLINLQ
jgi:3-deoxy-D-manno-octulosonic-acid transferase